MEMALMLLVAAFASITRASVFSPPPPPPPRVSFFYPPPPPPPPPPVTPAPNSSCSDSYRLIPKVDPAFCLTGFNDGSVVMERCSQEDLCQNQLWKSDNSWGNKFQDAVGNKAFTIINAATGRALYHGYSSNDRVDSRVLLVIEDGFLWTMSDDLGDNFHTFRSCQNINLNLDVDHGDRKRGGVKDHNQLILFEWKKGDNQLWRR